MPKKELDLEEQDVTVRIETAHMGPALKTRISASLDLVEEVLVTEPDKFL